MIYTLTLNPALDYYLYTDTLQQGAIHRARRQQLCYGGKGINVSVMLRRLGAESVALGFLAGFTGAALEAMLQAEGVTCDFCYLSDDNTRINVKIRAAQETDINAPGPAVTQEDIAALSAKLQRLQAGDTLVLAGSVPDNVPVGSDAALLGALPQGVRLVADVAGDLMNCVLPYRPFLVKPNHHELGDFFGETLHGEEEIVRCAARLQQLGAQNVLVSRAEQGALLLDKDGGVTVAQNAPGTLINSTGCGDSMLAGFLAGLEQTGDCRYALRLGTACGNATAYSSAQATRDGIYAALAKLPPLSVRQTVKNGEG